MVFRNREEAGQLLAKELKEYRDQKEWMVIALPRGGVVVGSEIAKELGLELDIVCPRKIGAPNNPEYALGAITESGEPIFSEENVGIPYSFLQEQIELERKEAMRRLKSYRQGRGERKVKGRKVILVDDGLATGSTMRAAIATLRREKVERIIVAVPVASIESAEKIALEADDFLCLMTPALFYAIGEFYEDFSQITDEEVTKVLQKME